VKKRVMFVRGAGTAHGPRHAPNSREITIPSEVVGRLRNHRNGYICEVDPDGTITFTPLLVWSRREIARRERHHLELVEALAEQAAASVRRVRT
jgi:hypothetical protein